MLSKILLSKKIKINFLEKNLVKRSGRNNSGKITVRGRISAFTKKKYRNIDFYRGIWNTLGFVQKIEQDPYRNCFIALIAYTSGYLSYIICPDGLIPGSVVVAGEVVPLNPGNATLLRNIPLNLKIHNIESHPYSGAKYLRSAGCFGYIIERSKNFCLIKFNSGLIKKFHLNCLATIGVVSNLKYKYIKLSKAGHSLFRGKKQKVRGVAMNPNDHPHGGGEGKKSPGRVNYSPWKKLGKNIKTVKKKCGVLGKVII